jgi:1-acyl-sn-glycerol-3-phosphate acyltransferase
VLPVAIHGSAHVRGWRRLRFPKVTIQYGEPVTFPVREDPSREEQQLVANQIFDRVRAMYVDLEENGRRDVLKRLREGLPAPSPEPDTARRYSS